MFYQSKPLPCSYYPDRESQYILFYLLERGDKLLEKNNILASHLSEHGFRRNNSMFYKPNCKGCQDCQSLRVDVNAFDYSKRFKRVLNKNKDISLEVKPAISTDEHFDLYTRYQESRHDEGVMLYEDIDKYHQCLVATSMSTHLLEFRLDKQLIAVAITDFFKDGLSAVYTYFEPTLSKRSLGTLAILKQLEICQNMEKPWLYLGYWINDHPKMDYKKQFVPFQAHADETWIDNNEIDS